MNKKIKALIMAACMSLGVIFSACVTDATHKCESKCDDCGKCTDLVCTEDACADKCEGHEPETQTYTVTWDVNHVNVSVVNQNVLPETAQEGTKISFTATAENGYENVTVRVNGTSVTASEGYYTVTINQNTTIRVTAEEVVIRREYTLTDATLEVKNGKPYYVLKGTYSGYTTAELSDMYFDMQNYNDFNTDYGWNTTQVDYELVTEGNTFAMYVDISELPVNTCMIPHFNATGGAGDIKIWDNNGLSITVGDLVYTIDMNATPYGCTTFTILNKNGTTSIPSDISVPTLNEVKVHEYFKTTELPRIDINTKNGIAIDDESLEAGWKVEGAVKEYDYVDATVSVANCVGYEMTDVVAEVKVRGNYTSTYPKRPIRIKFNKKQAMCGLNGDEKFKNWVLLAEYKDSSMLRNSVAFFLGNTILESDGLYSTDFRYVEVYLNGAYNGLYLLVEQQEVKEERIDVSEPLDPEDYENPTADELAALKNVYIGYSIEFDGYYYSEKEMERFTIDYDRVRFEDNTYFTSSQRGFSIKSDVYYQEQHDFIQKVTQNIWDIVYNATYASHADLEKQPFYTLDASGNMVADSSIKTPREAVEKVIDVTSLVDVFILNEICQDMDIGWSSFYMQIDFGEGGDRKLKFVAPWDFDSSLGSAVTKNDNFFTLNSSDKSFVSPNPWLNVCAKEHWFWTHVEAKWNALEEAGTFTTLTEMIEYFATNYISVYAKNYQKWTQCIGRQMEGQQDPIIATFKTQAQAANYLKTWVTTRISNLDGLIENKVKSFTS